MIKLDEALAQISEIRRQMARTEIFRGYRSATAAFSGALAFLGAGIQSIWLSDDVDGCLLLWGNVALVSAVVAAVEMIVRCYRSGSTLQRDMTLAAVEQFVPCLVAGGLLTYVMRAFAGDHLWMMPALWSICFSLGVFASRRLLPRPTGIIAGYYLLTGLFCLTIHERTLFPAWTMALTFGVGQFLAAAILYWTLERGHARE